MSDENRKEAEAIVRRARAHINEILARSYELCEEGNLAGGGINETASILLNEFDAIQQALDAKALELEETIRSKDVDIAIAKAALEGGI